MDMSRGKIIAGVAGGLFLVAAGVLGYLLYDSYSTLVETEEELEGQRTRFNGYYQANPFPSKKSIDAVASNKAAYVSWLAFAGDFAARGDKSFSKDESPASFKQRLSQEVRRLGRLPGGVEGRLVANEFMFGFDRYLDPERGVLPEASAVQRLAVQLDSVSHIIDMFAKEGVLEVKDVKCIEPAADSEEDGGSNAAAQKKKKRGGGEAKEGPKMTSLDYQLSFTVRPVSLVNILNALVSDTRFTVVKSFTFKESADVIVEKINAVKAALSKKDAPASGGRRRRGRRVVAEEPEEDENAAKKEDRLVVDPELDAPLLVDMTVTVYDFGRAGNAAADVAAPAATKEAK